MSDIPEPQPAATTQTQANMDAGLKAVLLHASVSLIIATYVFVLVLSHDLSNDVALTVFATIVGAHTTAAASVQIHRRRTDPNGH